MISARFTYDLGEVSPARKLVRASDASAFAASVLEQPGGPYSSTPRDGRIPIRSKASAWRSGHSTA